MFKMEKLKVPCIHTRCHIVMLPLAAYADSMQNLGRGGTTAPNGLTYSSVLIPTLGSAGHQWGPVELLCLCLCLSVRSSASLFGDHPRGPKLRAAHAAAGHGVKPPEW